MIGLPYGELSERFKEPVLKTGDAATHREFESHTLRQKRNTPPGCSFFGIVEIRKVKSDSPVDCRREAPASRTSIFAANAAKMQSNLHSPPASNQAKASNQRVPRIPTDLRTGRKQSNLHSPPASNQAKASNQRVPRIPTDLRTGRKQSNLHSPLPIFPQHILCILTPSPLHKKPHCAIIKEKTEGYL